MCRRANSHATEADELAKASPERPVALAVPHPAAVLGLLRVYQLLLEEAARDRGMLKRGTAGFTVDHVRRARTTLQRRYGAYMALSDDPVPAHHKARERLSEFAAALPSPPSRWRSVALVAAVLLVARLLLVLFDEAGESSTDELRDAVSRVSDLSPQNFGDTVEAVLHADLLTIWVVAMMFGLAAYLVPRPLANGWMSSWILRTATRPQPRAGLRASVRRRRAFTSTSTRRRRSRAMGCECLWTGASTSPSRRASRSPC